MHVKWKKNKNLRPDVILKKIDSIKTVSEDKKVSYSGFEYHDAMASLQSMINFPASLSTLNQEYIVSKAISEVAKEHVLEGKLVIDEINSEVKAALATREYKYNVLTSISLKPPFPAKSIKLESCNIRIIDAPYPKKYTGRHDLIKDRSIVSDGTPSGYAKVIIGLKAKSEKGAATKALKAIDIQRAIWCLFGNSGMEIIGNEWEPINKIRLGGAHTVHKETGKIATYTFWYEPNFLKTKPFSPQEHGVFSSNSKWAIENLYKSKYSSDIKDSLLRYVRALDERDQNVALIRLWGAVEALAAPSEANYDMVTRRCSFLFAERDYHKQVLEHLREYRNSSIHAGDQSERAKTNCFQLQFYFRQLVLFHFRNSSEFSSLEEANNFLDLPVNRETLENRKRLIEKAIKFVS